MRINQNWHWNTKVRIDLYKTLIWYFYHIDGGRDGSGGGLAVVVGGNGGRDVGMGGGPGGACVGSGGGPRVGIGGRGAACVGSGGGTDDIFCCVGCVEGNGGGETRLFPSDWAASGMEGFEDGKGGASFVVDGTEELG